MVIHPRIKALFFLIITLIVVAGVVFWMLFGDRSYLIVEGDTPENISGVLLAGQACPATPCRFSLAAGSYDLVFEKSGFYPIKQQVYLAFFGEQRLQLDFIRKPALQYVGSLQDRSSPLGSTVSGYADNAASIRLDYAVVENLLSLLSEQKELKKVSFSPTGSGAVVFTGDKSLLFLGNQKSAFPPDLDQTNPIEWDDEGSLYYFNRKAASWELIKAVPNEFNPVRLGTFYNLKKPRIFVSKEYIVLNDGRENYLLDQQKGSRKNILPGELIQKIKWNKNGNRFMAEDLNGRIFFYDISLSSMIAPSSFDESFERTDFYENDIITASRRGPMLYFTWYELGNGQILKKNEIPLDLDSLSEKNILTKMEISASGLILLQFDTAVYSFDPKNG